MNAKLCQPDPGMNPDYILSLWENMFSVPETWRACPVLEKPLEFPSCWVSQPSRPKHLFFPGIFCFVQSALETALHMRMG